MKPYAPIGDPKILEPERTSGVFVLREPHARSGVAVVLTGLFAVFWYTVVALTFSTSGWTIVFSIIMALFGLLPLLLFYVSLQHWQQRRLLEQTELKLSAWPISRGVPIELRFERKLKGHARIPNSGKVEWRITCAEVTRTSVGTDTTITHQLLWSHELPVASVSSGANLFEASAVITLPETMPASLEPSLTTTAGPNRFTKRKTSQWIEWQVQIAIDANTMNAPESQFALRVQ
jgi:hypothetical protein